MDESPSVEEIRRSELFSAFAACIRKILGELAGWSAVRVDERLERWLQNPGFRVWFGHDSPTDFAVAELIPASVSGPDAVRLKARLCSAIELEGNPRDPFFPHEDPNYDWQAARQRVAAILREYDRQSDSN